MTRLFNDLLILESIFLPQIRHDVMTLRPYSRVWFGRREIINLIAIPTSAGKKSNF